MGGYFEDLLFDVVALGSVVQLQDGPDLCEDGSLLALGLDAFEIVLTDLHEDVREHSETVDEVEGIFLLRCIEKFYFFINSCV
jgi:hypothetical protein